MSPTMSSADGFNGQAPNNRLSDFCWFGFYNETLAADVTVTDRTSWQTADDTIPSSAAITEPMQAGLQILTSCGQSPPYV
jgi:hypothetical protein